MKRQFGVLLAILTALCVAFFGTVAWAD